jgi:hypothetical protein
MSLCTCTAESDDQFRLHRQRWMTAENRVDSQMQHGRLVELSRDRSCIVWVASGCVWADCSLLCWFYRLRMSCPVFAAEMTTKRMWRDPHAKTLGWEDHQASSSCLVAGIQMRRTYCNRDCVKTDVVFLRSSSCLTRWEAWVQICDDVINQDAVKKRLILCG